MFLVTSLTTGGGAAGAGGRERCAAPEPALQDRRLHGTVPCQSRFDTIPEGSSDYRRRLRPPSRKLRRPRRRKWRPVREPGRAVFRPREPRPVRRRAPLRNAAEPRQRSRPRQETAPPAASVRIGRVWVAFASLGGLTRSFARKCSDPGRRRWQWRESRPPIGPRPVPDSPGSCTRIVRPSPRTRLGRTRA